MRTRIIFWMLLLALLAVIGGAVVAVLQRGDEAAAPPPAAEQVQYLATEPLPPAQASPDVPLWLILLVAGFSVFQILPLLAAARLARSSSLSRGDMREIGFLCEIPMYLGLLGSLFGVCATQFVSGSLAAPLAYLTSIVGIILYLLGRYAIWLPLPHDFLGDAE